MSIRTFLTMTAGASALMAVVAAAPAFADAMTSSAICRGVIGSHGVCSGRVILPVTAAVRMMSRMMEIPYR